MANAKLTIEDTEYEFPTILGSENELAIDFQTLRAKTGAVAYDPGYGNVGSCKSAITFIDGERGILQYRGYPVEQLAESAAFSEVCHLLIYGELPNKHQFEEFRRQLTLNSFTHEAMLSFFKGFPTNAHPMAILSSMISSFAAYYPETEDPKCIDKNIIHLIAKAKTIAAYSYKKSIGEPYMYPISGYSYAANLLRMMFATPAEEYKVSPTLEKALNMLLIVHADHEQNCSTSTVRMVGSSQANLFASVSAGIGALWGPLHGGANEAVLDMLQKIKDGGGDCKEYMEKVKNKKTRLRLMGFGHRVYKNYDPRARILKKATDSVLKELGITDPLLDIALQLEDIALKDEYFVERKLYPNVDFYSGILYRAMGIPNNMFTVMFALGRMPGWIAHWLEQRNEEGSKIHRPRQVYTGETRREFVPIKKR